MRAEYELRLARWDAAIARGERTHLTISNLRLAAAIAAVILAWLGYFRAVFSPAWALVPVGAFATLVIVHALVLNRNERAARARRYYEHGLSRLEDRWSGIGADGLRFLGEVGAGGYARDLDLFGEGSLFQLVNTARTSLGEETLARWFCHPALPGEIAARQAAVVELRDRLDFREHIAVLAAEAHVSTAGSLHAWAAREPVGLTPRHAALFASFATITLVASAAAAAAAIGSTPLVAWVTAQALVVSLWRRQVHEVVRRVDAAAYDLGLIIELLARIERERFESPLLIALHTRLTPAGAPPSKLIARLQRYIAARDWLRNPFARPFALLLLVRSQSAAAIDRWHAAHRLRLADWLIAIGEIEALASLATFAYEHPDDPFPTIRSGEPSFDASGLAHPLIARPVAIANDVRLGAGAPHVLVVSGSNMSGKSTLLRAVGVNTVLALAGAPVRASRLELTPLAIGATIRIEDSLQEGHSRFYAEILRIRDIVLRSRGPLPVLFLLDEILHGTNSHDRRIGAEAIVRSLVSAGAVGLVTTHDLALTQLPAALGSAGANVHFEDRIVEGKMIFDYRMREGVVERSNALELMRAVGLDV